MFHISALDFHISTVFGYSHDSTCGNKSQDVFQNFVDKNETTTYTVFGGDIMSLIGDRIRQARIEKGMTQTDLANALGKSKGTVSRYEVSSREPRYTQLCAIADALGVPVQQLAGPFSELEESLAATDESAYNQSKERRLKKRERTLLAIFGELSEKGQTDAIRRLSEMVQLPEYRCRHTLRQALSQYASQKDKVDYYTIDDVAIEVHIESDAPFGDSGTILQVRHIVLTPVATIEQNQRWHFFCYSEPVTEQYIMDRIISQHEPGRFFMYESNGINARCSIVFTDMDSYNLAINCMDHRYFDFDAEEIPNLTILHAQEDESDHWTIDSL